MQQCSKYSVQSVYLVQVTKLVPKEVEIPVKAIEYAVKETGCKNVFGFNVPCLAEGRRLYKYLQVTVHVLELFHDTSKLS